MCSIGRTSHVPSSGTNASIDTHSSSTIMSDDIETDIELSTSTPELNLLLVRKINENFLFIYIFKK
jgi:hypothetical protein